MPLYYIHPSSHLQASNTEMWSWYSVLHTPTPTTHKLMKPNMESVPKCDRNTSHSHAIKIIVVSVPRYHTCNHQPLTFYQTQMYRVSTQNTMHMLQQPLTSCETQNRGISALGLLTPIQVTHILSHPDKYT